jgi:Fe(3+) dicitrate transport protein
VGLTINESSDGGLQLSIGWWIRLTWTSNFNTRQNGYDISADVLGYPESYYATPTEALEEIKLFVVQPPYNTEPSLEV